MPVAPGPRIVFLLGLGWSVSDEASAGLTGVGIDGAGLFWLSMPIMLMTEDMGLGLPLLLLRSFPLALSPLRGRPMALPAWWKIAADMKVKRICISGPTEDLPEYLW